MDTPDARSLDELLAHRARFVSFVRSQIGDRAAAEDIARDGGHWSWAWGSAGASMCGGPIGWASIVNKSPNMFTLIAFGIGAAYIFSLAATVAPGIFPGGFRMHAVVESYFDTAVVVTVLVLLGQVLELQARGRTSSALRHLLGLAPKMARVIRGGEETEISIGDVHVGDTFEGRDALRVSTGSYFGFCVE